MEIKRIKLEKAYLNNIVKWNDNYFLTIDANKKSNKIRNKNNIFYLKC